MRPAKAKPGLTSSDTMSSRAATSVGVIHRVLALRIERGARNQRPAVPRQPPQGSDRGGPAASGSTSGRAPPRPRPPTPRASRADAGTRPVVHLPRRAGQPHRPGRGGSPTSPGRGRQPVSRASAISARAARGGSFQARAATTTTSSANGSKATRARIKPMRRAEPLHEAALRAATCQRVVKQGMTACEYLGDLAHARAHRRVVLQGAPASLALGGNAQERAHGRRGRAAQPGGPVSLGRTVMHVGPQRRGQLGEVRCNGLPCPDLGQPVHGGIELQSLELVAQPAQGGWRGASGSQAMELSSTMAARARSASERWRKVRVMMSCTSAMPDRARMRSISWRGEVRPSSTASRRRARPGTGRAGQ